MGETNEGKQEEVSSNAPTLSDDRLYRSLASRQRRRLLFTLLDEEETSVEEMTRLLTGWDVTQGGLMARPGNYEETRTKLVHNHLPLLDDAGFVDYDRERGAIYLESLGPVVTALIRQSVATEPSTVS